MATPPVRAFTLLVLATLFAAPVFAEKGPGKKEAEKKAKEAEIAALEAQIHHLREHEKVTLKKIDERFNHIIRNMDPKAIHQQLEEILPVLHQVGDLLSLHDNGTRDGLNYGGNRMRAHESIVKADHQVERALKHDTPEERAKAAEDIGAVHEDLRLALVFSAEHPAAVDGV